MHVLVCGHEFDLGVVVAQRLIAQGHRASLLTSYPERISWLKKHKIRAVVGGLGDATVQEQVGKVDAVIDVQTPFTFSAKKVHFAHLRPSLLRRLLKGSGKTLIVTSDAAILGDTGSAPVDEGTRQRPLRGFAWLPRLETEILNLRTVRGVVIRPAWLVHGDKPGTRLALSIGPWIVLAKRFRRGKYIAAGENCWSAVHCNDLADLYCLALAKAKLGTILHAASENISMRAIADAIHRGYGLKGNSSSISLTDARRLVPVANRLILSHALSCDRARLLGWAPSRDSVLQEIERIAREDAFVARLRLPGTECKEK